MDSETREYLEAMRHEFAAMREEMDTRFDAVDRRIEVEHDTTRRHFDVATEALRHEIQAVGEGVLSNSRAIDELRSDVYRDMNAGFGLVHLAFVDVRRQLAELRDRGAPR